MTKMSLVVGTVGWEDFDQSRVAEICGRERGVVDTSPRGGMLCPLNGHDHWLLWQEGNVRNGTIWHGSPPVSFHASPTYVLRQRQDNFIAGHELIQDALNGTWKKAETHRLGHEDSEDALTWNVFRSLQEAGELPLAVELLGGVAPSEEPELYLWGQQIGLTDTTSWDGLARARRQIEPRLGQHTEPDCCIRVPGEALIFIEATLGSSTATKRDEQARDDWCGRSRQTCPGLFDREAILNTPPRLFPEQLLRNVALAHAMRQPGEQVAVVALTRKADETRSDAVAQQCLREGTEVDLRRQTWESIYSALPPRPQLDELRSYFERKSFRLQPAFALPPTSG
jgi:hypothetical protein